VLIGAKYFANNLPAPDYRPLFGVLWDMIGDKDLLLQQEGNSVNMAPEVVARVWQTAADLGYASVFVARQMESITDDHVPLLQKGLRVIDVIDLEYPAHHTPRDTIDQVSAKLGLKPPPLGSSAEEVMVHLFLLRPSPNHFAGPELRRHATLRRARILLNQVSGAVIAICLAWAGWNIAGVFRANDADEAQARQLSQLGRDTEDIMRALPSGEVGGSTMRDAVTFYNGAIRPFPSLGEFLRPLSEVLAAHEGVRLTQLSWQATDNEKAVLRFTDDVVRNVKASDKTLKAVQAFLSPGAVVELTLTIGYYMMVCRFLETTGVEGEDGQAEWLKTAKL
jgi:hypothetical protein